MNTPPTGVPGIGSGTHKFPRSRVPLNTPKYGFTRATGPGTRTTTDILKLAKGSPTYTYKITLQPDGSPANQKLLKSLRINVPYVVLFLEVDTKTQKGKKLEYMEIPNEGEFYIRNADTLSMREVGKLGQIISQLPPDDILVKRGTQALNTMADRLDANRADDLNCRVLTLLDIKGRTSIVSPFQTSLEHVIDNPGDKVALKELRKEYQAINELMLKI